MSKRGLVFVAHGSHNPASNNHIAQLTEKLNETLNDKYSLINYAFLEFVNPTISDAIKLQIQNGSNTIVLFPYFLSIGNHVSKDIPNIIDTAKKSFPDVTFEILPPLGAYEEMINLIIQILQHPVT